MITKEQAIALGNGTLSSEIHCETVHKCKRTVSPRGGVKDQIVRVRVSGRCQTWKIRPGKFRLPIKYGMCENLAITDKNAEWFHLGQDCPINKTLPYGFSVAAPAVYVDNPDPVRRRIPVWECPRCSYVMTAQNEFGDEEELLAEFERVGQRMAEGDRDPEPGEIAQCFRCGKFAVIGEDLQLRMPTTDEQLAINTNAHLTESQIVWASFVGAHRR